MNRRKLLEGVGAAGAALTVAGTAQAVPIVSPDTGLVALVNRYDRAREAYNAYTGPEEDAQDEALYQDMMGAYRACLSAQPTTLDGLAAKARAVLLDSRHLDGTEMLPETTGDRMARSIVHDLIRLAGGVA